MKLMRLDQVLLGGPTHFERAVDVLVGGIYENRRALRRKISDLLLQKLVEDEDRIHREVPTAPMNASMCQSFRSESSNCHNLILGPYVTHVLIHPPGPGGRSGDLLSFAGRLMAMLPLACELPRHRSVVVPIPASQSHPHLPPEIACRNQGKIHSTFFRAGGLQ
jgi:hypothetical protein